ncbi:unnamed protein product [Leptosia nina]|uniref:Ig-like domain-containing protein n=1 Tax=Leptosia nina TaxID=320188 RepID=A0AAV1IWL5_9NEOP
MWRLGVLLTLIAVSEQLSILTFDVPNAVRAGDDAALRCQYELSPDESDKTLFVKWWWTPINGSSDERSQLYQRIAGRDPVAIHHNIKIEENDGILLLNVSVKDSGVYECEVSNIDEVRVYEKLIVFTPGSGVELDVIRTEDGPDADEDEEVIVSCKVEAVAPYPHLTITVDGELVNTTDLVINSSDELYDAYSNVTLSDDATAGSEITCRLAFADVNVTDISFVATEIYNGTGLTTESTTEVASTEATENYEINSQALSSVSWSVIILAVSFLLY